MAILAPAPQAAWTMKCSVLALTTVPTPACPKKLTDVPDTAQFTADPVNMHVLVGSIGASGAYTGTIPIAKSTAVTLAWQDSMMPVAVPSQTAAT